MTRLLIAAAVALALGGALAVLLLRDPGYVLISYARTTLETSLWFAVLALLLLLLTIYAISFVARRSLRGGARLGAWMSSRRHRSARLRARQGAMLLAEGRWQEAGRALAAARSPDTPLLENFALAQALNEAGDFDARDEALEQAKDDAEDESAFVAELVRSELQQAKGQWQESVATLQPLQQQKPRHPLVLQRLFAAYQALDLWDAVAELAPSLPEDLDAATQAAIWCHRLAKSQHSDDAARHASNTWKAAPKSLRDDEDLLLDYVGILVRGGALDAAEAALRQGVKRRWTTSWVRRYGEIHANPKAQLATASAWLKDHAEDPTLLLTVGRLALAAGDSQRGRECLEASAKARPDADALVELATLSEANGDLPAANRYFRQALAAPEALNQPAPTA